MGAGRRVIALLVLTFAYLFIGASIFSAIESAHEEKIKFDLYNRLEAFVERNPSVNVSEFREVLSDVWYAASIGMERMVGQENYTLPSSRWDLANAFFFSATVITTIGYGHLSPATSSGQNFCIAYAYFGIPLMAVLLSEISSKWKQRLVNVGLHLDTRLTDVLNLKHDKARRVAIMVLLVIPAYVIVVIIPAAVFSYIEGWDFQVAHYYCFISLSTIGLGDYVATQHDGNNKVLMWVYKIGTTLYLIAGLGIMAIVFNGTRSKKKHTHRSFRKTFANILRKRRKPWLEVMEEQADVIVDGYPVEGGVISSTVAAAAVAIAVSNDITRENKKLSHNDLDSCGSSSDNNDSDDEFCDDSVADQQQSHYYPHNQENHTDVKCCNGRNPDDFPDPTAEEDPPYPFQRVIADSHTSICTDMDSEETEEGSQAGKAYNDVDNPKHSRKSSLPQRLDFRNFGAHKRTDDRRPESILVQSQPPTRRSYHGDTKTDRGGVTSNLVKKKLWSPSSSYAGEDSGIHAASSQSIAEMESSV